MRGDRRWRAGWLVGWLVLGSGCDRSDRVERERAVAAAPDDPLAARELGRLLVREPTERARGVALLEASVQRAPADGDTLVTLGHAYVALDRIEAGRDLLRRALAVLPEDAALVAEIATLSARLPPGEAPPRAPNVVLVVIDTLRADHVGTYGYGRPTTPTLDAMAGAGVVFETAVSQAPWTAASVASLLTGLHPSVHGLTGGIRWDGAPTASGGLPFVTQRALSPAVATLPRLLHAHGFHTAGFVSNVYLSAVFGFAQGFDLYRDERDDYAEDVMTHKRRGEVTIGQVHEWLATGPREPFFLLVHLNDPHWPYDPPAAFGGEWIAGYDGPLTPAQTGLLIESEGRPIHGLTARDVAYLVGLYDGEIRHADHCLGLLQTELQAAHLTRPLLTVVTADHGEEFLEHGSGSHGYTLYDEQIRVPLVLHWPDQLRPQRIAQQVRSIDVLPTVLDLVGVPVPALGGQGRSLVPLLQGDVTAAPGDAFSEATLRTPREAVRTAAGAKLVLEPARAQLFDLRTDPGEHHDVAASDAAVVATLRERLGTWRAANRVDQDRLGAGLAPAVVVDPATRARLRALGYLPEGTAP